MVEGFGLALLRQARQGVELAREQAQVWQPWQGLARMKEERQMQLLLLVAVRILVLAGAVSAVAGSGLALLRQVRQGLELAREQEQVR